MFLADIFFPKFCLGCGYLGDYICLKCKKKLNYIEKQNCLYCKRQSLYGLTHSICARRNGIDGVITLFQYNDFLKIIIKNVKYRLAKSVLNDFLNQIKPYILTNLLFYKNKNVNWGLLYI